MTGWLLLAGAVVCEAQPAVPHLLVLQSLSRGNLALDSFTANFRIDLEARAGKPVSIVQFVVGPTGLVAAPEQALVDYIRATFSNRPVPDLIVTIGGLAATFVRKHRSQIFPETPLLLASVDQQFLLDASLTDDEAAVAIDNDFSQLVDDILQLLPETRQVFTVVGPGPLGTFWRRELEDQFTRLQGRLTFLWSDDLTLHEILQRCANLPPGSAIVYLNLMTDAEGGTYADERVLADLHATASAPLFGKHTVMLGHGVVGGRLVAIEDLARITADAAFRLLDGAPPGSLGVPLQVAGQPIFDWRELQRWASPRAGYRQGVSCAIALRACGPPIGARVFVVVGGLAIQSLLIIGLFYERRARRRAEIESRNNLALAADASRRLTMSALTSSIAHELGQPLSWMIHNAQAGRMMITADRATPDTMGEILSDIETEGVQATFVANGLSIKALHREIMTSAVYQLSGDTQAAAFAKDAGNRLYWHATRRRLSAEQIRDAVLLVSGALDARLGGPSVPLTPLADRRTIYGRVSRYKMDEFLQLFDFPSPSQSAEQRFSTSVPLQRLFFMNSDFIQQHAERVAERVADESDDVARIEKVYRLLFGRAPTADELKAGRAFLQAEALKQYEDRKAEAKTTRDDVEGEGRYRAPAKADPGEIPAPRPTG